MFYTKISPEIRRVFFNMLNYPYSGAPASKLRNILKEIHLPENFSGRVGCLKLDSATGSHTELSFQPIDISVRDYRQLCAPILPLREEDCPAMTLSNARGESLQLKDFFSLLFRNYPDKPAKQGGIELLTRLQNS